MEIGVATRTIGATLISAAHDHKSSNPGFNALSGGTFANSGDRVTAYGNVWNTYQLSSPYTPDQFSRLRFDLHMDGNADFVGICLAEELDVFSRRGSCFHLSGNDISWGTAGIQVLTFNLALGKQASQSSQFSNGDASNAINGILPQDPRLATSEAGSITYTDVENDPWWEVNLEREYSISHVVLYKNTDTSYAFMDDLSNVTVSVYDISITRVFYQRLSLVDAVTTIEVAPNTIAARVRVALDGERRVLSLGGVQVIERLGLSRHIDIPIGALFDLHGYEPIVNYVTFVQGSSEGVLSVSSFAAMTFLSGSSPEI